MNRANLKPSQLLAYAGPCLPIVAFGLPTSVYVPNYYASHVGLSLTEVGSAFAVVRLLDIGLDPILGGLMDAGESRWGRFRPWLAAGAPIMALGTLLLFLPPVGSGVLRLWLSLAVAYAGLSICNLAHLAWGAGLSDDYGGRSRVYAWWANANVVGQILILAAPALITGLIPALAGSVAPIMGVLIALLLPLTIGAAVLTLAEPQTFAPASRTSSLRTYLQLAGHPNVLRLLVADLLISLAPAISGVLYLFFFERVLHLGGSQAGVLLLVYFGAALAGGPIWPRLAGVWGKHRALAAACLLFVLIQPLAWVVPKGHFGWACAYQAAVGLPFSAGPLLIRSMMADVGDEVRLELHLQQTGLLFSLVAGTTKVAYALAILIFPLLQGLGFSPRGGEQGLGALAFIYAAAPAGFALAAAAVVSRLPLDERRHFEIRRALAVSGAGAAAPPRPRRFEEPV